MTVLNSQMDTTILPRAQRPIRTLPAMDFRQIMASKDMRAKTLVVDVRDDDYAGGAVAGAVHVPASAFDDTAAVDAFLERHLLGRGVERVVFYCMLSQVRGPYAARQTTIRLLELERECPEVCVLAGGFSKFSHLYGGDPALVQKLAA